VFPFDIRPADAMKEVVDFNRKVLKGIDSIVDVREIDVAPTAKEEVYREDELTLYHYLPRVKRPAKVPVLGPSNTAKGIPQIGEYISRVSAPVNAVALARQFLRLNEHPALSRASDPGALEANALPPPDVEMREASADRSVITREWQMDSRLSVRYVSIGGLAHAWSGGDAAYAYNDAHPPPATEILARFARDVAD